MCGKCAVGAEGTRDCAENARFARRKRGFVRSELGLRGRTGICAEGTLPARREMSKKLSEAGEDGRKPLTNALFRGIILQKSSLLIAVFAFFARERRKEGAFLR